MVHRIDDIPIAGTEFDKRRKLTIRQSEAIRILNQHGFSYSELAKMFGCSKSNVQNIIKPFKRTYNKKYDTAYCTEKKREYRERKRELLKQGKI